MKEFENNRSNYHKSPYWYNLDEKLEDALKEKPKRRFSLAELAKSIYEAFYISKYNSDDEKAEFDALNYLKKNGSDIISRLKNKLAFDIELHNDDPVEVKFEKLKILKVICIAEKFGTKKDMSKCYLETYRYEDNELPEYQIPLIDIMTEPSLAYVGSEYSECSLYKAEFDRVLNLVRKYVEYASEIECEINKLHNNWKKLITSTQYDAILENPNNNENGGISKEDSIRTTFKNIRNIPVEAYTPSIETSKTNSSLLERFYVMLFRTKYIAEIRDYHKLRRFDSDQNETVNDESNIANNSNVKDVLKQKCLDKYFKNAAPSENIRNQFVHNNFYNKYVTFSEFAKYIQISKESIENFVQNEEKKAVWSLILLKEAPDIDDVMELYEPAYKFALKYTQKIADIWYKYLLTEERENAPKDYESNLYSIDKWCIVFRELLYIFLKGESIDNKCKYYRNPLKTLTAAVKSNSDFEALPNMILIKHLQDRLILMYQSPDVVRYRQEIEKLMLDAEEAVLQYQTMDEIREADRILRFIVGICSESEEFIELKDKLLKFDLWSRCMMKETYTQIGLMNAMYTECTAEQKDLFARICQYQLNNGIYWEYDIRYKDKYVRHDFLSALSRDESCSKLLQKSETAMHMIVNIFSEYIKNPANPEKVQSYSHEVNLCFQDRTDYRMYFTFAIDHKQKIIIITSCTFDDDIQKILNQ
ncbi:MAG: hypothetical protein K2J47_00800 [Ruminococcus sp.]|nr:hypothetical protein [Ruminococcus sp.]